jgi:hypothetical protein
MTNERKYTQKVAKLVNAKALYHSLDNLNILEGIIGISITGIINSRNVRMSIKKTKQKNCRNGELALKNKL